MLGIDFAAFRAIREHGLLYQRPHGLGDDVWCLHLILGNGENAVLQIFARNGAPVGTGAFADVVRAGDAAGTA